MIEQDEAEPLPYAARLLLAIRRQRGWSQQRLAADLNVSPRTIRRWERGRTSPPSRDLALFRLMLADEAQDAA